MYRVIVPFIDRKDPTKHKYGVGESYPRAGYVPKESRVTELAGTANQRGVALIEEVAEPVRKQEKTVEGKPVEEKPKKGRKKNAE